MLFLTIWNQCFFYIHACTDVSVAFSQFSGEEYGTVVRPTIPPVAFLATEAH